MSEKIKTLTPAFPIEEAARFPLPGTAVPGSIAFTSDDKLVTYLHSPEGGLERRLFAYEISSGRHSLLITAPQDSASEENISLEEALRRERLRRVELGVTDYAWAQHGSHLLAPLQGDVYVCDGPFQPLRKLVDGSLAPSVDARLSPDGEWVAYVQDAEVYVVPFAGGTPVQLSFGARQAGVTHGLAEFIAQEEMARSSGYWWSDDSRWIAYTEVDEKHIPVYRIVHQGKDKTGPDAQEDHHYPFAGQENARVRLGVIPVQGGETRWLDLGDNAEYLARVNWLPDGRLAVQVQNRAQTRLELRAYDLQTGAMDTLLVEESGVWINLHQLLWPLKQAVDGRHGAFIWGSERSGFRHLYLYDGQGNLLRPLTQGEWLVESIAGVDEDAQWVYFTATKETPLETHLYRVSLAGGEIECLTRQAGIHSIVMDHACKVFVDTFHCLDTPPRLDLYSVADGSMLDSLYEKRDARLDGLHLQPPELVQLHNRQGTLLYGALYRPPAEFGPGPYPALIFLYGGPSVQLVSNSWLVTARMRVQYLRSLGFLVFTLDNRGSARRGLAFEGAIKYDMGHLEVEDQVDGVHWLVQQGLADPQRVGVYGWSYGGYMSAMCLARAPETFQVAVAGAPAIAYDGYDTHYTERYMGTPQANPQGYASSNVMNYVENIQGRLMIVHGLIDENVHFRHTARMINALIAARKRYELLLFPDERHLPRKLADRVYMEERIRDFLVETLLDKEIH